MCVCCMPHAASLYDLTERVAQFLTRHAPQWRPELVRRYARSIICHTFNLSTVQWACDLTCTTYPAHKLDWLWDQTIDQHTPLSRIIGRQSFWNHDFTVSPYTLDPRWETEGLIERIHHYAPHARHIMDLGTGTGCILISLLKDNPHARGTGIDICAHALTTATHNALALDVNDRCTWIQSDWFNAVTPDATFDVIVTNPPYVRTTDRLPPNVTQWDPAGALFAGVDGLDAYRAIFPCVHRHLTPGGLFIAEIGADQGPCIQKLAHCHALHPMHIQKDAAGRNRYAVYTSHAQRKTVSVTQ